MSSRYYPLFVKGNPQLRVFLPNFWMKVVKADHPVPQNQVQFHVSMEMTKHDIKNYLEKIYKVQVEDIKTHVQLTKYKRSDDGGYIIKHDDIKVAYVTLPKEQKFEFPNLVSDEKRLKSAQTAQETDLYKKAFIEKKEKNWDRPGIPSWFGK